MREGVCPTVAATSTLPIRISAGLTVVPFVTLVWPHPHVTLLAVEQINRKPLDHLIAPPHVVNAQLIRVLKLEHIPLTAPYCKLLASRIDNGQFRSIAGGPQLDRPARLGRGELRILRTARQKFEHDSDKKSESSAAASNSYSTSSIRLLPLPTISNPSTASWYASRGAIAAIGPSVESINTVPPGGG